ncbi:MAG: hypothetical protein KDB14_19715 [Planctomycetales bacterium]|nr:hypothetical protein [Planctomycetales bacterium]
MSNPTSGSVTFGAGGMDLAQGARRKQLRTAKSILIGIGVLSVIINGVVAVNAEAGVDRAIEKELADVRMQGLAINEDALEVARQQAVKVTRLVAGAFALVGVAYIVMGVILDVNPVAITISGLVIYIGSMAVTAVLDPSMLLRGLVVKGFIIAMLFKSIQAAIEYQRAEQAKSEPALATSAANLMAGDGPIGFGAGSTAEGLHFGVDEGEQS